MKVKRYAWPLLLLTISLSFFAHGGYLKSKAVVAQWLLYYSWQQQQQGIDHPPWPWADGHVVAKIEFPSRGKSFYVLSNASGRNLAFGPGHLSGTALPGEQGHIVISGHKDSHFDVLQEVIPGDDILLYSESGIQRFVVHHTEVVDANKQPFRLQEQSMLTLITCYPFDSDLTGGTLRYLVHAQEIEG